MTREEAVRSFTTWNALASWRERDLGSLEVGTLVGGEIVCRAA
jgi:imidazolonepropionase-like amidohydrolase